LQTVFLFLLTVVSAVIIVPVFILTVEVLAAIFRGKKQTTLTVSERDRIPSFMVLVPAHDEELILGDTLNHLTNHLDGLTQVLVIADNCTDQTAAIARAAGALVLERHNPIEKGKGFALDFGVESLRTRPPEVIIVLDADCQIANGSLASLAAVAMKSGKPCQSYYRMRTSLSGSVGQKISAFAWLFKNYVRPTGLNAMGLPCQLMGSGMALPWSVISQLEVATGEIVEDLKLGIDCALLGHSPLFIASVCVESFFPESADGNLTQRKRWESGHLRFLVEQSMPLILTSIKRRNLSLLVLGLDLLVPPLAFYFAILLILFTFNIVYFFLSASALPLTVLSLGLTVLTTMVVAALVRFGKDTINLLDLLHLPKYILDKIPLYASLWTSSKVDWVRTKRGK
jgi:cellulose synthase/poly-beta-1,6-N-acetylglucosamine synthase-like glycosyltransferase